MKKLTLGIAAISLSVSSFAWGPAEQAGTLGVIVGALIVAAAQDRPTVAPPPEVILAPRHYETYQRRVIVDPHFIYQPPTYSQSTGLYTYRPPMMYDMRSGQWLQQSKIYIPADKHFVGCNFYNYDEAWECIHRKEAILRGFYVP